MKCDYHKYTPKLQILRSQQTHSIVNIIDKTFRRCSHIHMIYLKWSLHPPNIHHITRFKFLNISLKPHHGLITITNTIPKITYNITKVIIKIRKVSYTF